MYLKKLPLFDYASYTEVYFIDGKSKISKIDKAENLIKSLQELIRKANVLEIGGIRLEKLHFIDSTKFDSRPF